MKRVFTARLKSGDLRHLIHELREYKDKTLPDLVKEFLRQLADEGISVANAYVRGSRYEDFVVFEKTEYGGRSNPKKTVVIAGANNSLKFQKEWYTLSHGEFVRTEREVNPILMLEFGSGQFAVEGWRGTFPEQHTAFLDHWHWYEYPSGYTDQESELLEEYEDGMQKRQSSGERPRMPMQHAIEAMELRNTIAKIARRVFG